MHGLLRLISFFQYSHCMLIHFLNQLTIIFGSVPETGPSDDIIITRDSEVIMFSPRVFVCLCVCANCEGLVPHKHYFACTLLGISSCASYVSRTHYVIDDVTRSQS